MFFGKLGMMQGRLSPPKNNLIQHYPTENWEKEFSLCKSLGLQCIEWIFEYPDYELNALFTDSGIEKIKNLSNLNNIEVTSVVADYFMVKRLFNEPKSDLINNIDMLKKLIKQCYKAGIPIIELPFVDSSSIVSEENKLEIRNNLIPLIDYADDLGIKITLETDLNAKSFGNFIDSFGKKEIFINYDMGNSAALGYKPLEEIKTYGDRILNVHIKDRVFNGTTVPLGEGDTDFKNVFKGLKSINYSNDFIFQSARQDINTTHPIDLMTTIVNYKKFIKDYIR